MVCGEQSRKTAEFDPEEIRKNPTPVDEVPGTHMGYAAGVVEDHSAHQRVYQESAGILGSMPKSTSQHSMNFRAAIMGRLKELEEMTRACHNALKILDSDPSFEFKHQRIVQALYRS